MEDQQPDPDDVTTEHDQDGTQRVAGGGARRVRNRRPQRSPSATPRGKRQRRASGSGTTALLEHEGDDYSPATTTETGADDVPSADTSDEQGTARSRFNRWQIALVAVATAVFVGSLTFAGAGLHAYLADRAEASTRTEVVRTAVAAVTTLWTYTPETIDTLADRARQYLSGDFGAQYRKFLAAAAAPNKQAQVTDSTEVVGAGVESLNGSDAVAIVFTNTTATSPLTKNVPSLKYVGYRLTMTQESSRWLVTGMSTVSFTDLTPQL
ncbi:mammalian cell entry protein [Mycobacterium sp. AT1]|uniref:mammalian cell entry protein n=1 Tax=Mycobacterium sp. AT1 TaxID=1961706 RepID=UPI0009AD151A|nr:mammalian cell entry protein [Mycobacterium sp. AT1]OPX05331.1 mammalian cell entry protein [Mycobacterium sp. AT1]